MYAFLFDVLSIFILCTFMHWYTQFVSCVSFMFLEKLMKKVLKRQTTYWCLPKGTEEIREATDLMPTSPAVSGQNAAWGRSGYCGTHRPFSRRGRKSNLCGASVTKEKK